MRAMAAKYLVKVIEKVNLAGKYWAVKLEKPLLRQGFAGQAARFEYLAGEYVSILVNDQFQRRSYSLASKPGDNFLELIFDVKPEGLGSNYLKNLEIGQKVEILGPLGKFSIVGELIGRKMLFVGTGSGIVPLWSMINDLLVDKNFKGEVQLHWGMRDDGEMFMESGLDELKNRYTNFSYDVVMSQASERWPNCRGHVQDCLVKHGQNWQGWEVYLCGNQKMVLDVAALLMTQGVARDKIYFEKYY